MPEETKAPRSTWSQQNAIALAAAYQAGGVKAACAVFPDKPAEAVEAKLESLGLLVLEAPDQDAIHAFVERAHKSSAPALFRRHAIAALRKAGKQ